MASSPNPVATSTQLVQLTVAAEYIVEWTEARNQLMVQLRGAGVSLRDIAKAAGLSHAGVKKIVEARS